MALASTRKANGKNECRAVQVGRTFFKACTKLSDDDEDILPQEDAVDYKLSVFRLFAELFPEFTKADVVGNDDNGSRKCHDKGKNGLMRLQFNKLGYEIYEKEQSRRVPAVRAKPGNPGYGFRRARWRDPIQDPQDAHVCEAILMGIGVSIERIERVKKRVQDYLIQWDEVRRPSRPAGPGRPRASKRTGLFDCDPTAHGGLDMSSMVAIDIEGQEMAGHGLGASGMLSGVPMQAAGHLGATSIYSARLPHHAVLANRLGRQEEGWEVASGRVSAFANPSLRQPSPLSHKQGLALGGQALQLGGGYYHMDHMDHMDMQGGHAYMGGASNRSLGFMGRMGETRCGSSRGLAADFLGDPEEVKVREASAEDVRLNLMYEDNQYLRHVNKSMIAERERLNIEIEQADLESDQLLQQWESSKLLAAFRDNPNTQHTVDAFRVVLSGIAGTGRGRRAPDREAWQKALQVVGSVSSDYQRVHLNAHISERDRMQMGAESQMMNASMLPAQGDGGGRGGGTMMGYAGQEMCGGGLNGRHPEMLVHQAQAAREAAMRSQVHHHSAAHTQMLERESTEDEAAEAGRSLHATWETIPAQRRPCPSWGGGQRGAMSVDARLASGGVSWGGGYRAQEAMMGMGGSERLGISPHLGTGGVHAYHASTNDAAKVDAALREYQQNAVLREYQVHAQNMHAAGHAHMYTGRGGVGMWRYPGYSDLGQMGSEAPLGADPYGNSLIGGDREGRAGYARHSSARMYMGVQQQAYAAGEYENMDVGASDMAHNQRTATHTAYESAAHGGASSVEHAGNPAGHPEPFTLWQEGGFPALDRDAGGMQGVAAAQDVMHGNAHVKRENYDGSDSYDVSNGTDSYNASHPANKRPKSEGTPGAE